MASMSRQSFLLLSIVMVVVVGVIITIGLHASQKETSEQLGQLCESVVNALYTASTVGSRKQKPMGSGSPEEGKGGLAVGGAKDVSLFRQLLEQKWQMPKPSTFTSSGLFAEYYFDMTRRDGAGRSEPCAEGAVFCPRYEHVCLSAAATAKLNSTNDVSAGSPNASDTHYLTIGLDSGLTNWHRKPMDVVFLLDTSGSMQHDGLMLLQRAMELLLKDQLNSNDHVGVAEFGCNVKELNGISPLTADHAEGILRTVRELQADCGTPMHGGLKLAQRMLSEYHQTAEVPSSRERRIIVLTDAMPNVGASSANDFSTLGMQMFDSRFRIGMTFLGTGYEFDTKIMAKLGQRIPSFTFRSLPNLEAVQKVAEEFRFLVSPLAHRIVLRLDSDDFEVDRVYGIDNGSEQPGDNSAATSRSKTVFMDIPSFFPSPKKENTEAVKGGIILLRLVRKTTLSDPTEVRAPQRDANAVVSVVYETPEGDPVKHEARVLLNDEVPCARTLSSRDNTWSKGSTGLRKGIVLSQYFDVIADVLKDSSGVRRPALQMRLKSFQEWFNATDIAEIDAEAFQKESQVASKIREIFASDHLSSFIPVKDPIWRRIRAELIGGGKDGEEEEYRRVFNVSEEEYVTLYKAIANSNEDPMFYNHFVGEGEVELKGILYVPDRAPYDAFASTETTGNMRLHIRNVFSKDKLSSLLPRYLHFVHGVVDTDDLPLHVPVDELVEGRVFRIIRRKLIRLVFKMLQEIADSDRRIEKGDNGQEIPFVGTPTLKEITYPKFWKEFGNNIRLGVIEDEANRARLVKLLRYRTSKSEDKYVSLEEYVEGMPESQKSIYYQTGDSIEKIKQSPAFQAAQEKGVEVLFITDAVDEYIVPLIKSFGEKKLVNIAHSTGLNSLLS